MNPSAFLRLITALGLNQTEAADFLGVKVRTVQRWVAGAPIPHAVHLLLEVMVSHGIMPARAERLTRSE